ncbi:MAG: hypothetical protein IPG71_01905 [bacterium]|nr:hypothetical protein [bacterium]
MQHLALIWLVLLLISSTPAWAGQAAQSSPVLPQDFCQLAGPQAVVPIPIEILNGDPAAVSLRIGEPQLERSLLELNGETFERIALTSEGSQLETGAPDLPRVTRLVMIEPRGNVEVQLLSADFRTESLTRRAAPKQSLDPDVSLDDAGLSNVYSHDGFWPQEVVRISQPQVFRDVRFVVLEISPVQYNPVTNEMRVYESLDIAIDRTGGQGLNEREIDPVSITPGFRKLYENFINFEHGALDELPIMPGTQLFICQNDPTVISGLSPLVNWRKQKGIDASIATLDVTGSTPAQIRTYINSQYTSSNGQLEFVTVVGDPDGTGSFYFPTDELADYPYGQLDNLYSRMTDGPNPDPLPDLGVGRLPVQNSTQLNAMVAKSVNYEANPFMADSSWFTRTWCAVHTGHIPSNPSTKEYTRQIMLQRGLNPGAMTDFVDYVTVSVLEQRVNEGVSIFNHRLSWGNSEMNPPDLYGLANGAMTPFVAVITCGMGWYNNGESVTEAWVRRGSVSTPTGAIGAMGMCGNSTRVAENNIVDGGAMYGLLVKDIREQSLVMLNGKLELFRNFWSGVSQTSVEEFSSWCNLMGDPAVPIRLDVPKSLSASFANLVHKHTNNVPVTVTHAGLPVEGALVGLYKSPNVFARGYTDENGFVNLGAALADTGWVKLTVTGTDLKTIRDSIHVVNAAATLALSSVTVDDDNVGGSAGNGDGVWNTGEIAELNIMLVNRGTSSTATGITATLSCSEPFVSIQTADCSYPNISVGATASPVTLPRALAGGVQNGEPVPFYLTVNSSAGTQVVRVDVTPIAGDVLFDTATFLDGNSQLDPGESGNFTISFQNTGGRALTGALGLLRSHHPQVIVTDSLGAYGAVGIGATADNSVNPFGITATLSSFGGLNAELELVIIDSDGFRDSLTFVQTVGVPNTASPTGPDEYGYFAYDNTETQPAGTASQYSWIDIATIGANIGFSDESEDDDDVAAIALPFDFTFYGNSFDSVTICSNGWIAFGDHSNQFDFRNWHIGSPMGPPNMVAAYWDDLATTGGGVYYYAVEHEFIVQWNTATLWSGVPEVFQIILYDPLIYPSPTGDGKILVQYQSVEQDENWGTFDIPWATVGIQNQDHSAGLEYSCLNVLGQNAAPLADGRAIMYTTASSGTPFSTLTVLTPNGGNDFVIDNTVSIGWFQGSSTADVRIELSRSGADGPWTSITSSTPNSGSYDWTVSGPASSNCYLRILSNGEPDETDTSDAAFTIGQLTMLLSETFESGAAGWSIDSAGGQWISDWHISTERAASGIYSYKCGSSGADVYRNSIDAYLISPVVPNIPVNAALRFVQQYETETSGLFPDSAYDGFVLEYSENGGPWSDLTPNGGYNKTFRYFANQNNTVPATGPMLGRPCFGGTRDTWETITADLDSFVGSNMQFRFRFGSDLVNGREGWYVDDVEVYSLDVTAAAPVALTIQVTGSDVTLRWADAGYQTYFIYSALDAEGPFATLEGTSMTNSFTISNGTASARKFYYVTGE